MVYKEDSLCQLHACRYSCLVEFPAKSTVYNPQLSWNSIPRAGSHDDISMNKPPLSPSLTIPYTHVKSADKGNRPKTARSGGRTGGSHWTAPEGSRRPESSPGRREYAAKRSDGSGRASRGPWTGAETRDGTRAGKSEGFFHLIRLSWVYLPKGNTHISPFSAGWPNFSENGKRNVPVVTIGGPMSRVRRWRHSTKSGRFVPTPPTSWTRPWRSGSA